LCTLSRISIKEYYLDLPKDIGRPKCFAKGGVSVKGRISKTLSYSSLLGGMLGK
jgi:hypothetical protein